MVGSISQRDPVGAAGSGTGRKALGSTSALIAAFTGDRPDSRCGLNPAPIEAMPMMIWLMRGGGGLELCGVSVLCGAGGGLTVQADNTRPTSETTAPMAINTRRARFGTLIRVSSTRAATRPTTSG